MRDKNDDGAILSEEEGKVKEEQNKKGRPVAAPTIKSYRE